MFGSRQFWKLAFLIAHGAIERMMSPLSQKNGHLQLAGEALESGDVIGMLVSDQDGGDFLGAFTEPVKTPKGLTAGEAGVDKKACGTAGHERAVPTTAAGNYRHRHCHIALAYARELWKRERILMPRHLCGKRGDKGLEF